LLEAITLDVFDFKYSTLFLVIFHLILENTARIPLILPAILLAQPLCSTLS